MLEFQCGVVFRGKARWQGFGLGGAGRKAGVACGGRSRGTWTGKNATRERCQADIATATRPQCGPESGGQLDRMPSWRLTPLVPQDLDQDEGPHLTMGRPRGEGRRGRRDRRHEDSRFHGGSWGRGAEQPARLRKLAAASGPPDAVVTHHGTAGREHVLEEAVEEFHAQKRHPLHLLSAVDPVVEGDLSVGDAFQAGVGDRDPEAVAA